MSITPGTINSGRGTGSAVVAFSDTCQSGDPLWLGIYVEDVAGTATVGTITDTRGNTYAPEGGTYFVTALGRRGIMYRAVDAGGAAGANTVTVPVSAGDVTVFCVRGRPSSGVATFFDVARDCTAAAVETPALSGIWKIQAPDTITTARNNEIFVAFGICGAQPMTAVAAGWSSFKDHSWNQSPWMAIGNVAPTPGTYGPYEHTVGGSTNHYSRTIAYTDEAAGGGGGAGQPTRRRFGLVRGVGARELGREGSTVMRAPDPDGYVERNGIYRRAA